MILRCNRKWLKRALFCCSETNVVMLATNSNVCKNGTIMTEQQIPKFVAVLVENQNLFLGLSTEDAQWVIQNPKWAIRKMVENLTGSVCGATEQVPTPEKRKLLELVRTVSVPGISEFRATDKFKVGETVDGVKISQYMGDNFKKFFLPKIESNVPATEIRVHKLFRKSRDLGIRAEIGEGKEETTLGQLWEMLKLQGNGQDGVLLTNGWANIFYIRDINGNLWAVYAHWYGVGWDLNADSVESPSGWRAGGQVCSR